MNTTLETHELFGSLREALSRADDAHWGSLLSLLEGWPQEDRQVALEYARDHTNGWPLRLKRYPVDSLAALMNPPEDWVAHHLACSVVLENCGIEDAEFIELSKRPYLGDLRGLYLRKNRIGGPGVEAIASAFDQLEELDLRYNLLWSEEMETLADSPSLGKLRRLLLSNNRATDEGFIALIESPHLSQLEELRLKDNGLSDEAVELFCDATGLARLKMLDLHKNDIYFRKPVFIGEESGLSGLETLLLSQNQLADAGAAALAASTLPKLQLLDLSSNSIEAEGFIALAHASSMTSLRTLKLAENHCCEKSAAALAQTKSFPKLELLDLSHCYLSEASMGLLKASDSLKDTQIICENSFD